jgi:integrase
VPALADELRGVWTAKELEPKTRGAADPLHPGRPCRFRLVKVAAVTTKMVQEFVEEVAAARAPNTTRRIFDVLNSLMKLAAQRGYIAVNPCDAVEMPSKKRAGVRRSHLTSKDRSCELVDALPEHWRLPVLLDGSHGLRPAEVWALRRRDVNLLHRELSVRFALKPIESSHLNDSLKGLIVGHPNSAASRRRLSLPSGLVPLLEAALLGSGVRASEVYAVARERAEDVDRADLGCTGDVSDPDRLLLVTPRGYPVRHNLFYKRTFKPAVEDNLPARLHRFRFRDLRHTCAALSLAAPGGNLAAVKERLGCENIATTVDLTGSASRRWTPPSQRRWTRRSWASPSRGTSPRFAPCRDWREAIVAGVAANDARHLLKSRGCKQYATAPSPQLNWSGSGCSSRPSEMAQGST